MLRHSGKLEETLNVQAHLCLYMQTYAMCFFLISSAVSFSITSSRGRFAGSGCATEPFSRLGATVTFMVAVARQEPGIQDTRNYLGGVAKTGLKQVQYLHGLFNMASERDYSFQIPGSRTSSSPGLCRTGSYRGHDTLLYYSVSPPQLGF